MKYDLSELTHMEQLKFMESIKHQWHDDAYYKVFYNRVSKEFLLSKIDFVIKERGH